MGLALDDLFCHALEFAQGWEGKNVDRFAQFIGLEVARDIDKLVPFVG